MDVHSRILTTFVSSFLYRFDVERKLNHTSLQRPVRNFRYICSAVPSLENGNRNRFVDLRTLKTTSWQSVDKVEGQQSESPVGFNGPSLNSVPNPKTLPISSTEQKVVETLLSGQSVLFSITRNESISQLLIDIVNQLKTRKQAVLYCACSIRAAQRAYMILKSNLGDCTNEVVLATGDVSAKPPQSALLTGISSNNTSESNPEPCIIITVPDVLLRSVNSFFDYASILVLEQVGLNDSYWEEIVLGLPKRVVACLIGRDIAQVVEEHILLWLRQQNRLIVPFSSSQFSTDQNDSDKSNDNVPRLFLFNCARHEKPHEFSMTKARSVASESTLRNNLSYASALIDSSSDFQVMNIDDLRFRSHSEAEYVDFASIILGDFVRTNVMIGKDIGKRESGKRTKSSVLSRTAMELRDACFRESNIFPVIAMCHGERSAISAASTVLDAADDPFSFLWNSENRDRLHDILHGFIQNHQDDFKDIDHTYLSYLAKGIGLIHNDVLPSMMMLAEELFHAGIISMLFVDTHIGSRRLTNLPQAKSVLVQSCALGSIVDTKKGMVSGRVAMSLVNSGNVITLWNDDSIDEEEAAGEIAFGFIQPECPIQVRERSTQSDLMDIFTQGFARKILGPVQLQPSSRSMWTTYSGVLRSMRCFGSDGFKTVIESTIDYYQVWLGCAVLQASREKMRADCKVIESRLENMKSSDDELNGSGDKLSEHQSNSIFETFGSGVSSISEHFTNESLRMCEPGTIIGLKAGSVPSQLNGDESKDEFVMLDPNLQVEYLPAIFVSLLTKPSEAVKSYVGDSSLIVLCIGTDGSWNAVPPSFVVTQAVEGSPVFTQIERLEVPHLATFDMDSSVGWAKRYPQSESTSSSESTRFGAELRELCTSKQVTFQGIASEAKKRMNEIAQQSSTFRSMKNNEEINEMNALREQFAQLSEQEDLLGESERRLNSAMKSVQEARRDATNKIVAVLEDSNAIRVHDEGEIEMTPLGALTCIVPGPFPLFIAACLLLVQNIDQLEPPQLASFVALISGIDCEKHFSDPDEEMTLSRKYNGVLSGAVPESMLNAVEEIFRALYTVAERHKSANLMRVDVAPVGLSIRLAKIVFGVSSGSVSLCRDLDKHERSAVIEQVRVVSQVLRLISDGGALGEFGSDIRQSAELALTSLRRWPLDEIDDYELLAEKGVLRI